ncbi:MAG: UDP-N-acetylmuramoyl-L-alanine--D-glutamate ligase [Hyphomicrobiales bacterium]
MIPVSTFAGKTVAVVGLGGSGLPTAHALHAAEATVVGWDDGEAAREKAIAAGVRVENLEDADWGGFDALVLSPGIPLTHPAPHWSVQRARAAGVPITGDVDLFFQERAARCPQAPVLAITGTNGKSTTTALAAHAMRAMGVDVAMGGNIGVPVLDLPLPEPHRHYVIECSSYQIDLASHLAPTVGVHLNLSEDHLARHGTMENYAAIKKRLVAAAKYAVVGVDDLLSARMADALERDGHAVSRISAVHTVHDGVYAVGSTIWLARDGAQDELFDLGGVASLKGEHNAQNVCAVVASLLKLGMDPTKMAEAIRSFPGLAHRMEPVATFRGVSFVNDSKATNADAAARALGSYERIYWILGGQAKSDGIDPLNGFFPQIVKSYLVGEAQDRFAATLEGQVPYVRAQTVERAVAMAAQDALADGLDGACVLLSPACASWDQFASFEARGDAFKRAVSTFLEDQRTR